MAQRNTATYVYCIVRGGQTSDGPPDISQASPGLPGLSPATALDLGEGLWAVTAEAPLPSYSAAEIEARLADLAWVSDCAVAHERVVEHFSTPGPAVPMKLFTLYSGDERAIADLTARRADLAGLLERLDGRVEWGVRIRFVAELARRGAAEEAAAKARPSSGTGFLLAKKREREGARTQAAAAAQAVEEAWQELSGRAVEARRRDLAGAPPEAGLLLDAAFLVPRDTGDRAAGETTFEETVDEVSRRIAGRGCEVTLTGPWPPYNFVQDEP